MTQNNEGQAATVNRGFHIANGQILLWLNADDVLFSRTVISEVVKTFQKKQADVVYGHMAVIDSENRLHKILFAPPKLDDRILQYGHFAACISFRRSIALRYLLNKELKYALDYDQCLRMAHDKRRFVFINKPMIAWRKHEEAKSMKGKVGLENETKRLHERYENRRGIQGRLVQFLTLAYIMARKFWGILDVVKFFSSSRKKNLPFIPKEQSLAGLMIRQLLPYI